MPQRNNKLPPRPPTVTWKNAVPLVAVAAVFDAARMFFEMFWLFGPVLLGAYCTGKVSEYVGMLGGATVAACGAGATIVGYVFSPHLVVFGSIMAIAVGIFGWLTVMLLLAMFNARIFKTVANGWLWSLLGLGVSVIPIVGAIPSITLSLLKLYHAQIKKDRAGLKEWQKTTQEILKKVERARQEAELARLYQEQAAAEEEIPEERPKAA